MLTWIIIIIGLFVLIGLLFIKISHAGKKVKLIAVALIILFIYFSASSILSKNNIKLNSVEGYSKAISLYLGWFINIGKEAFTISGNTIKTIGNIVNTNHTIRS